MKVEWNVLLNRWENWSMQCSQMDNETWRMEIWYEIMQDVINNETIWHVVSSVLFFSSLASYLCTLAHATWRWSERYFIRNRSSTNSLESGISSIVLVNSVFSVFHFWYVSSVSLFDCVQAECLLLTVMLKEWHWHCLQSIAYHPYIVSCYYMLLQLRTNCSVREFFPCRFDPLNKSVICMSLSCIRLFVQSKYKWSNVCHQRWPFASALSNMYVPKIAHHQFSWLRSHFFSIGCVSFRLILSIFSMRPMYLGHWMHVLCHCC